MNKSRSFMYLLLAAVLLITPLYSALASQRPEVTLQILSVSDWHAQLDPINGVGGAAVLSSYFKADRLTNPNTLTLTAGDAYGASPPLSNFFDEEPAVLAMRLMEFSADTFGNHNFDRGIAHLQRMIDLAGAPAGSQPGSPFSYVSANLKNRDQNLQGVKDYQIFDVGGVKVAVIGLTNPEAPTLVFPGSFGTIEVTDPVSAANRALAAARREGAKVFIALTHMGVTGFDPVTGAAYGPLIDFAENVGGFNVILGDHTDFQYSGVINNALVVENRSKGLTYAKTQLTVDPANGRVKNSSVTFVTPLAMAVTPDPAVTAMLQPYRDALGPIFNTVIGEAARVIPRSDACGRSDGRLCESLIGNTVTDSMRFTYTTDFAITNSGGLRADLTCPTTDNLNDFCPPFTPPPYPITRGQVLSVLPFGNVVVTINLTGAEVKTFLENGVLSMPAANGRFPQVSGLCFTYDVSAPPGSRVLSAVRQAGDGSCTGEAIDLTEAASYSVATNDFMASGGDGYPYVYGRSVTQGIMDQVLADYVSSSGLLSPSIEGRITCVSSGAAVCPAALP